MEHDRIVLTGTISFHYFAGFGGGRKALVPGCREGDGHQTHFRIFRTTARKHPMARPGILAETRSTRHRRGRFDASPTFLVNTLLTRETALRSGGGAMAEGPRGGMRAVREPFPGPDREAVPLVIASAAAFRRTST